MLMDYLDSNIALISRMQDKGTLGRFVTLPSLSILYHGDYKVSPRHVTVIQFDCVLVELNLMKYSRN